MTILEQICEKKRQHVESMKTKVSQTDLLGMINKQQPKFIFEEALFAKKELNIPSIIAEIKKASPSKGIIRENFDPSEIAKQYTNAGATCISCLTDEPYFQGKDAYLKQVKAVTNVPVLRKDFMIDIYQIYESRALGADAILIIMAALDDAQARDMYALATELGMSALFEVHNKEERERALALSPKILGINNRNLKTLDVSLDISHELISHIPDTLIRISESGLSSHKDLESLTKKGFDSFLIGEALMAKQDEHRALHTLLNA